ncbi:MULTISPECIES: thioesterase family protein [unclassified Marinobacter]|uniref:thioesterase family protein n=1 Tax=unclassified Marinobacter TaxID=83889 RepID=UPI000BF9292B|nr:MULTISPECIES: thioesterase family protein [unclassified Marinobacter]PFG10851.1 acyl-CoA thioesterase FadM [Marinobacter sp. LV10MA510-1]PFG52745.1 acyl-CoA thioesterase FadM [Marinobacter sp. LV10R520-4]
MARIKLEFPEQVFCFQTRLAVRSTDLNGANHLGNDALISMLSEARVQLLSHHGIDEVGHNGLGILVTDLATVYQAETYYPETLVFDVGITDFNRYGGDFVFRVTRERDGAAVAQAKYGFVFFDYGETQVTPMPDSFRLKFAV